MTAVEEWLQLGLEHHRAGRLQEAESLYQQVLQHDANHTDALHLLGTIASQVSKFDIARDLVGRALALRPDVAAYHASFANVLSRIGALEEAGAHYDKALALKPDFAEAHNGLGQLRLAQGQIDSAIACFRRAIASERADAQAHHNLGNALALQGDFSAAILAYQAAIALEPVSVMPYADLAKVLAAAGRTFDAIDVCLGTIDPQQGLGHEQRQRAAASQVSAVAVDASSHGASGTFFSTTDELIAELDRRSLTGDMEGALGLIQRFVRACVFDRRAVTKVFADSRLDERCRRVGEARLAQLCDAGGTVVDDQVDCVILATELYRLGGHTAVIGDLLKTQRFGPRTVVMLTDAFNSADPSIIGERFGSAAIGEIAPKGGLAEKLTWTLNRLRARRPRRLILMNHHNDAVAIAAAQPSLAEETIFYHHCDHQLCLGVTLPHTVHVDPHPMGFYNCRDVIGVSNVVYWPFAADDLGGRTESAWKADGRIRTCSSGSNNKFESPYKYMYAEIIPRVMACTGGVHVHIGPLSVGTLAKIRKALMQLDVPPQRFVHVPWVRSVWKALQSFHIDIVLASFPQGGGKALIEAMGAGIPVIGHDCYISPFLGGADLYYPGAFFWTHPDELLEHLNCLSPARLERESQQARQHFEQLHTNEALSRAIDGGADAPLVPDRRPHKADPLQLFLDDVHYAAQDYSIHVNLIK